MAANARKHCYLPHRSHLALEMAARACSVATMALKEAARACSVATVVLQRWRLGTLHGHSGAPKWRWGLLRGHYGAPKWHLWPLHGHSGGRNGCSGLLCVHNGAQNGCCGLPGCNSDARSAVPSHIRGCCSKKLCSVTLDYVAQHSALPYSVHGHAQVHSIATVALESAARFQPAPVATCRAKQEDVQ